MTSPGNEWDEAYGWSPGGASGSGNPDGHGEGMGYGDARYTNEVEHTHSGGCYLGGGSDWGCGRGDCMGGVEQFMPGDGNTFLGQHPVGYQSALFS